MLSEFTATRLGDDHFYLVGAAAAEWHDLDLLETALPADGSVTITNRTHELGTLVIVGPRSRDVLAEVTTTPLDNESFPWLSCRDIETAAGPVRALRVSYVGELGWELHAANAQLVELYQLLWAAGQQHGIRDIGIYAVDSMRLDKCYRSWKADLEIGFSPLDASLDRFVDFAKDHFVGRDALLAERARGPRYRFVPLTLDRPGDADAPANSSIYCDARASWDRDLRRVELHARLQHRAGLPRSRPLLARNDPADRDLRRARRRDSSCRTALRPRQQSSPRLEPRSCRGRRSPSGQNLSVRYRFADKPARHNSLRVLEQRRAGPRRAAGVRRARPSWSRTATASCPRRSSWTRSGVISSSPSRH